jgi:hypothetical protein
VAFGVAVDDCRVRTITVAFTARRDAIERPFFGRMKVRGKVCSGDVPAYFDFFCRRRSQRASTRRHAISAITTPTKNASRMLNGYSSR